MERFVEPYLKSNISKFIQESSSSKPNIIKDFQENSTDGEGQIGGSRKKAKHTKLKVTFSNGLVISEDEAVDTFIKTVQEFIQKFGIDKVIEVTNDSTLIIADKDFNENLKQKYKRIPDTSFYLQKDNSTYVKKSIIEKLAKMLQIEIDVDVVPKQ